MKLYRFIFGPEKARVGYEPSATFAGRLAPLLEAFADAHQGIAPNRCYVSVRFPDPLPPPLRLPGHEVAAVFDRQTLLGGDEVLFGVEIEVEGGDGDERFDERSVG